MANASFLLGFDGEYWHDALACLVIPAGGGARNIVVSHHPDGWVVLLGSEDVVCDDLLMTAAIVANEITLQSDRGVSEYETTVQEMSAHRYRR